MKPPQKKGRKRGDQELSLMKVFNVRNLFLFNKNINRQSDILGQEK